MAEPVAWHEVNDKIAIGTMKRPKKFGAVNRELRLAKAVLWRADHQPDVSVALLQSEGCGFYVGQDICESNPKREVLSHDASTLDKSLGRCLCFEKTLWTIGKPVIAAVRITYGPGDAEVDRRGADRHEAADGRTRDQTRGRRSVPSIESVTAFLDAELETIEELDVEMPGDEGCYALDVPIITRAPA
jgi:hypothetical protein